MLIIMKTLNWKNREWLLQETWGQVHPKLPHVYHSPECVKVDKEGNLHLHSFYKPKFYESVNRFVETPIGFACCMDEFHFGYYNVTAKLPEGKHMWAAIWLYNIAGWISEIDIVEAYSNRFRDYRHPEFWRYPAFYKLDSNFHYHENGKHKWVGTKRFNVGLKSPSKRFIDYGMAWTPEYIHLFADGMLQRELKGDIMEHFQEPMRFILSTGLQPDKRDIKSTDFIIKDFTYIPYKI
jgi:hypothetical protein